MRYLGIDYGTKEVGLAFSDEAGTMGFPFDIVPNDAHLAEALALLVEPGIHLQAAVGVNVHLPQAVSQIHIGEQPPGPAGRGQPVSDRKAFTAVGSVAQDTNAGAFGARQLLESIRSPIGAAIADKQRLPIPRGAPQEIRNFVPDWLQDWTRIIGGKD